VLVLDAGDYSMGTAFGAASAETGGDLWAIANWERIRAVQLDPK
jgi:hypothetical protein